MCIENWQFSSGIDAVRLEYFSKEIAFDEIIQRICDELKVVNYDVDPSYSDELLGCKRPVFKISVSKKTFDIFFNSPCGYRGQYFLNPDMGLKKNNQLIHSISVSLIDYATNIHPAIDMTHAEIYSSLHLGSAKIWIDEDYCDFGTNLMEEIINPIWSKHAERAHQLIKDNPDIYEKRAIWGLRAPIGTIIDIKGGWIDGCVLETNGKNEVKMGSGLFIAI